MDENKLLELILDYKMTKDEAKAWKIAILYLSLAQEYFPNYKHYRLPKGDPRTTSLFRHCYKLLRECDLQNHEYRLYLIAQFQILKNIEYGESTAFIQPNCMVGDKAWKRWLVWKTKFFDKVPCVSCSNSPETKSIIASLEETKKFLISKFSELSRNDIIKSLDSRAIFRWCGLGEVSGYYLVLSPIVKSWLEGKEVNLLDIFAIDMNYYRKGLNNEVESYFRKEFRYEF